MPQAIVVLLFNSQDSEIERRENYETDIERGGEKYDEGIIL